MLLKIGNNFWNHVFWHKSYTRSKKDFVNSQKNYTEKILFALTLNSIEWLILWIPLSTNGSNGTKKALKIFRLKAAENIIVGTIH